MRKARIAAVVGVLLCVAPYVAAEKRSKALEVFSKICGVDVEGPADGVYAKGRKKPWQQYPSVKVIPHEGAWEMAQYWHAERGSLVQMATRDGQYTRYHEYCFNPEGKLTRLTYETRAHADGWGFATTGTVNESGHLVPAASRFFGLRSHRTMPRPPEAAGVDWVLHPKIYKRVDKLPFAKLMTTPTQPTTEQKKEDAQAH